MHQTFYVDVDEEVSSVINRLRKSTSQYNILAVAQQSLILQSSVSLKLIKKEMDMLKKKVMVITQDEHGLAMAKKVGFPIRKTIGEIKKNQISEVSQSTDILKQENKITPSERNRLKNLGDKEFIAVDETTIEKVVGREKTEKNRIEKKDKYDKKPEFNLNKSKDEEFDSLFVEKIGEEEIPKKNKNIAKGAGKFLWTFFVVGIILLVGIFAYLFFPKAEISITPKNIQKNINLTVEAQKTFPEGDSLSNVIRLKSFLVEEDEVFSFSFDATGQKSSANKKARGTVTIYNNFSEASQILVATTRFLSEDGKLFRLTKSITVPGMKTENEKKVSGEIEAKVIADQSGEKYNIDSTTFKIPGFEGGPKYDKFSAKSKEKMKGGGESESVLKSVSQTDIDNAEKEVLEKVKSQLAQKIKEQVGNENIFSEDAIEYEILDYASFPELGAIADNFEYQIKVRAKYLTFSNTELDEKINKYINENILQREFPVKIARADKKYGKLKNDFTNNFVEVELTVNTLLEAEVNSEDIKKELLGKNQEEVDAFIEKHPELKKIDAIILPSFLASRIPKYSSRVKVNISNGVI